MLIYFKRSIANIFTIVNLLLGFVSIALISLSFIDSQNNIRMACGLIFIAAILDVFDGKIARKLGTSSQQYNKIDKAKIIKNYVKNNEYCVGNSIKAVKNDLQIKYNNKYNLWKNLTITFDYSIMKGYSE